jgi:signal transduction histidine kinase
MKNAHFQTRARAIDHLGRGQIADCPTAVTELFKNAHDAYARNVSLQIFSGSPSVAAIFDNGCGMSQTDVLEKWLVVGTESKVFNAVSASDRFGLDERPRLGEKGIGRLSAGFLAPVTLVVTKKKDEPFVAALVDWRFFENPFLMISDIRIPVLEFKALDELQKRFPSMVKDSVSNLVGAGTDFKNDKERVVDAWENYSKIERKDGVEATTESRINSLCSANVDLDEILKSWSDGTSIEHGTAIILIDLNRELGVWVDGTDVAEDPEAQHTKDNLRYTLDGFIDPEISRERNFDYFVRIHKNERKSLVVDSSNEITSDWLHSLEHYFGGTVNEDGWFVGKARAFGKDRGTYKVKLNIPNLVDKRGISRVGLFSIEVGTVEQESIKSTHDSAEHSRIMKLQEESAGIFVYRDGARVLPYGRPESDFFGIEERRSKHAGREFFAHRRVFGRVRISRNENPHLRDKAGREGLVENQAKRMLREIVIQLLMDAARRFYGSDSPIRKDELLGVAKRNKRGKEAALAARKSNRKEFLVQLKASERKIETVEFALQDAVKTGETALKDGKAVELAEAIEELETIEHSMQSVLLIPIPKGLEDRTEEYRHIRDRIDAANNTLSSLHKKLASKLARAIESPRDVAQKFHYKVNDDISKAVQKLLSEIKQQNQALQTYWGDRFSEILREFNESTLEYVNTVESGESVNWAIDQIRVEKVDLESSVLATGRGVLESLRLLASGVDLQSALVVTDESDARANDRIEQLLLLAQSGTAVELISHELEEMAQETESNLKTLPEPCQKSQAFKRATTAFTSLIDRFRFLSPLSVATYRARRTITGEEISNYVRDFFGRRFESGDVDFASTKQFDAMQITDVPSRIFPVFVNLVNNSLYWVKFSNQRKIRFEFKNGTVIVADNGPGIDKDDEENLFQMFFTKRAQGRGIGLYLCRANLAVARHKIRIATSDDPKVLTGANFIIEFRGLND